MHVSIVSIPVSDQDRAKKFYTDVLGFQQLSDAVMQPDMRWVHLAAPDAAPPSPWSPGSPPCRPAQPKAWSWRSRTWTGGTPTCQLRASRSRTHPDRTVGPLPDGQGPGRQRHSPPDFQPPQFLT